MKRNVDKVLGLAVLVAGCQAMPPASVTPANTPPASTAEAYMVTLAESADRQRIVEALQTQGATVTDQLPELGVIAVQGADPAAVAELPGVAASVPIRRRSLVGKPVAPAGVTNLGFDLPRNPGGTGEAFGGYQWALGFGHVPQAWATGHQGQGVLVAVVDTGIDLTHPDLAANLDTAHARSFVDSERTAMDYNGHGTHVAGIIAAARNGVGIIGVAPRARLLPIKVLDAQGQGDDWGVMRGIDYAVSRGASVINLSLEGLWTNNAEGRRLREAYRGVIQHAMARGALVVVAGGNDGIDVPASGQIALPAQAPGALVVGAVGPVDGQNPGMRALYSNYGPGYLDLAAPGGGVGFDPATGMPTYQVSDLILSTWSRQARSRVEMGFPLGPSPYMFFGGTSMACAYTSGVAALARDRMGPVRPERLKAHLEASCGGGGAPKYYGHGVLDAARAVR